MVTSAQQLVPGGPVASQEAIKLLGTNGGGYFNANSAHPFENPSVLSNLFEIVLILVIRFSLPAMYGRMVGDKRQGYTLLGVMLGFWLVSSVLMAWAIGAFAGSGTGVGEGFEQRFGVAPSALFATATTMTSTGAVNVAHDSLPPLAGGTGRRTHQLWRDSFSGPTFSQYHRLECSLGRGTKKRHGPARINYDARHIADFPGGCPRCG